ncbi:MAG: magnesium transporter [Thermoleophilaceae bacterium]|nr:magnesium transporter [Thermoleophilaceae bacterium]
MLDAGGSTVGRLGDLAADPTGATPVVTALQVRRRRRARLLPWESVSAFDGEAVQLRDGPVPERALADTELLLRRDVLDAQIVDVAGRRVVRVGDVDLACPGAVPAVAAVEVGTRPVLRRLGLRRIARRFRPESVAWQDLHLAAGRGHRIELRTGRLERLGPAALAQVIGRVPPAPALEIVRSVAPEVAARSVATAHPRVGGRILRGLEPRRAARLLEKMPADDAAAALRHVDSAALDPLLDAVETDHAQRLRRLLEHPADTAGGLMSIDVRTAAPGEPADAIRARLAADPPPVPALATVFVLDDERRPLGAISPTALLGRAEPAAVPVLNADTSVDEVIDLFALHDVLALPVVDVDGRLVGAVAMDDVLEELVAERLPGRRPRYRRALRGRR